jgi:biotin carboxyl carrier protein
MTIQIDVPTPGTIIEVFVKVGDRVAYQQHLFTLELGKTVLTQRATTAGTITTVSVNPGDQVERNTPAITID